MSGLYGVILQGRLFSALESFCILAGVVIGRHVELGRPNLVGDLHDNPQAACWAGLEEGGSSSLIQIIWLWSGGERGWWRAECWEGREWGMEEYRGSGFRTL